MSDHDERCSWGVRALMGTAVGLGPFADPGVDWWVVGLRFGLIATGVTMLVVSLQTRPRRMR